MTDTEEQSNRGTIFTVGYGGKSREQFLEPLIANRIELIADIRMQPNRASMGMYVKAKSPEKGIEKTLSDASIAYEWFEELGNPDRTDQLVTFRALMARSGPERTRRLIETASRARTCLLCAEKNHDVCHRAIVGDYLKGQGWRVIHL